MHVTLFDGLVFSPRSRLNQWAHRARARAPGLFLWRGPQPQEVVEQISETNCHAFTVIHGLLILAVAVQNRTSF